MRYVHVGINVTNLESLLNFMKRYLVFHQLSENGLCKIFIRDART